MRRFWKYFEDGANRIFDILDVVMIQKGVKEDFLEFQPIQLDEQRCHFQKEAPPAGRRRARVYIRHPKSEMPITHPSADVKRTKKSWLE